MQQTTLQPDPTFINNIVLALDASSSPDNIKRKEAEAFIA
jgi:hypothetical protein